MNIQTENGYEITFPRGLEARAESTMNSPFRGETVAIPFVIRGEPGLLNVRFQVRNVEDEVLDVYNETFTSVLRPGGFWTNFIGRGANELKGELTVPKRLFPIQISKVDVENLNAKKPSGRAS